MYQTIHKLKYAHQNLKWYLNLDNTIVQKDYIKGLHFIFSRKVPRFISIGFNSMCKLKTKFTLNSNSKTLLPSCTFLPSFW